MEQKSQHTSVKPIRGLTFKLLEDITNNFSEDHKVGSGGFGEVYKGVMYTGETIAVKKLHNWLNIDVVEFEKEFNNLMRVEHQNIIRLVGYCYEIRHEHIEMKGQFVFAEIIERALCFEYLQCGSLDKHLSDESCGLDWNTRFEIIKGVCEGLNYLHNGCNDHIYHLDMKPANILLDENMMPKIADLGSAILFKSTQTYTTENIIGTLRYMPPEYIDKGKISKKFDVFSLGVIIIEIMAGPSGYSKCYEMPPQRFAELVHENWKKRFHTMSLHTSYEEDSLEVKMCIEMALRCIDADRTKRPMVVEVITKLNELDTLKKELVQNSESKDQRVDMDRTKMATVAEDVNKPNMINTLKNELVQSSESKDRRRVDIDPLELRFPFELNKQISSVLQLTNKSDDLVAFRVKANRSKYFTRPDKGVMPPRSKCYVVATMQAQEHAPPDMQCSDMFVVESTTASHRLTPSDYTEKSSFETEGEVKLPVVYVASLPDQPPQPSR